MYNITTLYIKTLSSVRQQEFKTKYNHTVPHKCSAKQRVQCKQYTTKQNTVHREQRWQLYCPTVCKWGCVGCKHKTVNSNL